MNTKIAQDALSHYDLPDAQVIFIGQSQNTTFRVETPTGNKFLLRIHAGIGANKDDSQDVWQELPVVQSELLWLQALHRDTPISVPQPVRNRSGKLVTKVSNPANHKLLSCTLLRWVEGEHLKAEPTPEQVRLLGKLMAQLHQHAIQWQLPSDFTRPNHDAAQLQASLLQLQPLRDQGTISTDDYEVLQTATRKIQQFTSGLERNPNTWGVVHADLQDANYVLYKSEIRPIDFGRCGFGFYLYDVALSLGYLNSPLHPHFFEGYQKLRALPPNYQPIVEAFFLASIVENFAFLSANPQEHTGIAQAIYRDVVSYFQPYLQDKSFLFDR